jgi:hypothetical protein
VFVILKVNVTHALIYSLVYSLMRALAGAMERVLLAALGGPGASRQTRPLMDLSLLDKRTEYLQVHSIETSTAKNYRTGARDYIQFCVKHSLPLNPTPQTLSRYISYTSQFIASKPKYLLGACHFLHDLYPDFDDNRSSPLVQATIAGSRKLRGDPIRRKLPLRPCHLLTFLERAHSTQDYDNFLFAIILSCLFYACHRIGELAIKNDRDLFDWCKIIKRSSFHISDTRASYTLPYSKTDCFYHGTHVLFASQSFADPVFLLRAYVVRCDTFHGAKPALFIRRDGSLPTCSWFDSKIFSLLDCSFGGHSARAGGATFYSSLGLSEDIIQAIGRWSLQSWKIYIRDNPTVCAELQLASLRAYHS